MNKKRIITLSILLTIILSILLVYIERKLINYTPKTTVVLAIKEIEQGEELKSNNFIEKKVEADLVTIGTIKNKEELLGKCALEKIYPNEILNKNRIVDKNDPTNTLLGINEREFSIPVALLDDPLAGTLRANDKVDILFTNTQTSNSEARTRTLVKQARIVGALDSSGKKLLPTDKNIMSAAVLFAGTSEDAAKVANSMYAGRFKLVKIPTSSKTSENIIVESGEVIKE